MAFTISRRRSREATPELAPGLDMVELDRRGQKLLAEYERLADRLAEVEAELKATIGDRPGATVNGKPAITWKWSKAGKRFDSKAFRAAHPTMYEAFTVTAKAARPFKVVGR